MTQAALFSVPTGARTDLDLPGGCDVIAPYAASDGTRLFTLAKATNTATVYAVDGSGVKEEFSVDLSTVAGTDGLSADKLTQVQAGAWDLASSFQWSADPQPGRAWDHLSPYVALYDGSTGLIGTLEVAPDGLVWVAAAAGHQTGFSAFHVFDNRAGAARGVYALGYYTPGSCDPDAADPGGGQAVIYQVSPPAYPGDRPSMSWAVVWPPLGKTWAPCWKRFSFFQMGGENYFFKTNQRLRAINIDHVMDDPAQGSHPVLNLRDIEKHERTKVFLDYELATPLLVGHDPHVAHYAADGTVSVIRPWGTMEGWDDIASFKTLAGAARMTGLNVDGQAYVLVYVG